MRGRRIRGVSTIAAIALGTCGGCAGEAVSRAPEAPMIAHVAGGWLEHARSPIVPFCQGVLIAPDVVVSAARCADEGWHELSFGVGEATGETIPVVSVLRHPLAAEDPAHALIALVLERAVTGVAPARLEAPAEAPCGVELPTYRATLRGEEGARTLWTACPLDDDTSRLVAMEGYPSCDGQSGAGAFVPGSRDDVIGWVTSAGRDGPAHPEHEICVTSVGLATVGANRAWLAEALARSRVAQPI